MEGCGSNIALLSVMTPAWWGRWCYNVYSWSRKWESDIKTLNLRVLITGSTDNESPNIKQAQKLYLKFPASKIHEYQYQHIEKKAYNDHMIYIICSEYNEKDLLPFLTNLRA